MKSIDYLKENLKNLHNSCSYLEIKYEYRDYMNTHIIEVKPVHCFSKDEKYAEGQVLLEEKFEELFPEEELLFITKNELISVENPILILGILEEEIECELVSPSIQIDYGLDELISYVVESKIDKEYEFPVPPDRPWWKSSRKNKKDFEHNSKSFFL
ncbi:MAG: hypothetical protein QM478_04395 [Flavobacteriaceae bacterium]